VPGLRRLAIRGLVVLVLDWFALLALGALLADFDVHGAAGALVTAVIAAALNALVWPTLSRLALPLSVLTLGGAAIVLNGGLVALAAAISPGASIDGWFAGVVVAVGLAIITTAGSALLAIDDDETWQRNVVRRQARRAGAISSDVPGVVFLEIDGLAHEVLRRALRHGNAPVMARWLRDGTHRLERLEQLHPRLVPALRDHPGIGFVVVGSEQHGAVAFGARGTNYLDEERVEGEDPLAPFGPNAAAHVRRTDGFPHCPDLLVNASFSSDTEEVAAFEELVGSHGGMGGSQSLPFVLFPSDLPFPDEEVVGAEHMHRVLRRWLVELGHDAYRDEAEVTAGGGGGSLPASR
jgi:uncharacterized membrane protein YvlD (DUF360 family)